VASLQARLATSADAGDIAGIYNEGIAERIATFETRLRTEQDVRGWFDGIHPIVVVEEEGAVVGFASSSSYRSRECYAGVAEFSVYVARSKRGRGLGKLALEHLMEQARKAGFWKLLSRIFTENEPSRALCRRLGFREVGTYIRHAKLDGDWRDVVVVEKFLAPVSPPRVAPSSGTANADTDAGPRFDPAHLDEALDAFTSVPAKDPGTRERFVRGLQLHGSTSAEAARDMWGRLLARFDDPARRADLARFYETLYVVKQAVKLSGGRLHPADLAPQRSRLLEWLKEVIALPPERQGRISPGNVSNLLMSLAAMTVESEEQRRDLLSLVPEAVARHRMEPPASLRPPAAPAAVPPPKRVKAKKRSKTKARVESPHRTRDRRK
jgi:L-amino acid N-acyltransferase YncA